MDTARAEEGSVKHGVREEFVQEEVIVDTFPLKASALRRNKSAHSRALDVHQAIVSQPFAMKDSGRAGSNGSEDGSA